MRAHGNSVTDDIETDRSLAERAIEDVLAAMEVGDEMSVGEGRAFLDTLVDQQSR